MQRAKKVTRSVFALICSITISGCNFTSFTAVELMSLLIVVIVVFAVFEAMDALTVRRSKLTSEEM